uniref:Major facilitator superfamily (MFS) profile domain-containing protein n=1 Tax=Arcella intermedia TaxID=1963864 RepID=A0A6B2L5U7_9EUKA
MEDEGMSLLFLGAMDTLHLLLYTFGQFYNGSLVDLKGPRVLLSAGLVGAAISVGLFGLLGFMSDLFWYPLLFHLLLTVLWGINGYAQSTGWPASIKALTPWFKDNKGLVMGLWTTSYTIGGILGTVLATYLIKWFNWKTSFIIPAIFAVITGAISYQLLPEDPEKSSPSREHKKNTPAKVSHFQQIKEAFTVSGIVYISFSYFCVKLIRYTLLYWLPYYLSYSLHYDQTTSGLMSTWVEIGGTFGGIFIGYISDYFPGKSVLVAAPCSLVISMGLFFFQGLPNGDNLFMTGGLLFLIGFYTAAPEILLSGVVVQDIAGKENLGSVVGVVNGVGSFGSALQGILVATIAKWSWDYVFYLLIVLSALSFVSLIPPCLWIFNKKVKTT